jgi:hypothetical protein
VSDRKEEETLIVIIKYWDHAHDG